MKIFTCESCGQLLFFENVQCTRCLHKLAYLPDHGVVSALEPVKDTAFFTSLAKSARGQQYKLCANYTDHGVCNWAVPAEQEAPLCFACTFNDVIPNLNDAAAMSAWQRMEIAKRRLLYTLMGLGLPLEPRATVEKGLAFSFKQDGVGGEAKVFTGHSDGLITINIAEADDPFREKTRLQMGEAYRTVLGHFRHEIGHYYWARLIDGSRWLEPSRALFGDERADYGEAMKHHYDAGAPADWPQRFVSAYASMHPWEDWAETWAHYLHIVDTLDTARSYGLALRPRPIGGADVDSVTARKLDFDDFDDLVTAWVPLTVALNSLNRAMGLPDLYPFVLSEAAISKLRFVHDVIEATAGSHGELSPT